MWTLCGRTEPRAEERSAPNAAKTQPFVFVDQRGREWLVCDRVRRSITPSHAEYRCLVPGQPDARSRIFITRGTKIGRVAYELRVDDAAWARADPTDVSYATLARQLRAACMVGAVYTPT